MKRRVAAIASLLVMLVLLALPAMLLFSESGARLLLGELTRRGLVDLALREGTVAGGLVLEHLRWSAADETTRVEIQGLTVQARWSIDCLMRSTVCLSRLSADRMALTLAESPPSDEPWELPANLRLPLRLQVSQLSVARFDLQRGDLAQSLRAIDTALRLRHTGIQLSALSLQHDQLSLSGDLALSWLRDWPLQGSLSVRLADDVGGDDVPRQWRLEARGPLRDLVLSLGTPQWPTLALSGELKLPQRGPSVQAAFTVDGLQALAQLRELSPWLDLRTPLSGELSIYPEQQQLTVRSAIGGWTPEPLDAELRIRRAGERLVVEGLRGVDGDGRTRLQLSGPLGSPGNWSPRLSLAAEGLSAPADSGMVAQLEHVEAALAVDVRDATVDWRVSELDFALHYEGRRLTGQGSLTAAPDHALVPLGELTGALDAMPFSYRRADAGQAARLDLPSGIEGGGVSLTALSASLRPGETSQLALTAAGDVKGTLQLQLQETAGGASLTVAPFRLRVLDEVVHSNETLRGTWSRRDATLRLQAACLQLRGFEACSEEAVLGASGELKVALNGEERLTNRQSDNPYSVFLRGEGTLELAWTPSGLEQIELALLLPVVNIDPYLGAGTAPPVSWQDVQLRLSGDATAQSLHVMASSDRYGELALDASRNGEAVDGTLALRALALPALDDLLPEVELRSGALTGDLLLSGTLAEPRLAGELRLEDGSAMLREQGVLLEQARLRLAGAADAFTLDGSALLGEGPITIDGRCCDSGRLTLNLRGERNRLRLPVGLDALLTPDLTLVADPQRATLTGSVRVHEGVFEHQGPLGDGISVSKDVVRLDETDRAPQRFAFSANLRALIDPGFTLRAKQLEATLGGDLRVSTAPDSPVQLFGELQVLGGELRAYGQGLRLDRGSVGFVGDATNPDLNLSAVRDIRTEQMRVGVRVVGTLDAPQLSLFSEPQRSERETLSYLLRGRPPDAGAGADSTAMALSLGASALNQSGLLETLNSVPGLSQVTLGAEGTDDETAATISAYVGERLYLSYGMGIYEPVNALTARLYLRSRLWVEVVSRLESSFDLYYRFDRD